MAVDISDASGSAAAAGSVAKGSWNTGSLGFALLTGTSLNDFSSEAGVYSAVGNLTADDGDVA